jgi:hypothetical protein
LQKRKKGENTEPLSVTMGQLQEIKKYKMIILDWKEREKETE